MYVKNNWKKKFKKRKNNYNKKSSLTKLKKKIKWTKLKNCSKYKKKSKNSNAEIIFVPVHYSTSSKDQKSGIPDIG